METRSSFLQIPLMRIDNGKEAQVAVFEFTLKNVPLITEQILNYQQISAVTVNGAELRLRSIHQSTDATAVVCASPQNAEGFSIKEAFLSTNGAGEYPPFTNIEG